MNVLIADDEPMTRSLLRRVLTRECGCTVSEVADGLAALSSCGSARPDLIVTDLRMPVMDGIGLIEALRQVPALAAIPVVMMTAAREQGPVHRAIELGVTDYLLKPLQADRVSDRLKAVIERVTRVNDGPAEDDRTPVLVADGNAEFRQFVAGALGSQRVVHQAPSGVAALQRAVETRPGIVLVGGELGLLGPALLMRKLRAAGELAGTRIVAVVPAGGDTAIPEQADAIVHRTSFAEEVRRQLAALGGRARTAAGVLAAHPSLRAQVATAAEQVFGMMLQLEVQHSLEIQPRPVPRMIVASLPIVLPETAEVLTIALRTDLASAAKIAAGMTRDGAAPVSGEERSLAAVAEVLGIIGGRIRTSLETGGARVEMGPPARQIAAAGDLSGGAAGR
ncbi:MAG TPA: response regulator, partial [Micromonosporaceae bacterium]|nr:response regulator [Micromonosporaceae bacterium]